MLKLQKVKDRLPRKEANLHSLYLWCLNYSLALHSLA